ncbi:MAG: class I SAM-dependent methyltransferase [Acidimicrobiales bacterium]|nr:class I SAM-dependent methyltransferase [Acidimicrobiales bacterium]
MSDGSVGVPTGNLVHKEATKNPIERRMVDGFARALQRALPATAARVLEVGCGEGRQLTAIGDRFPSADLIGLDLPDVELEEAWSEVPSHMVQASALDLPFDDTRFDLVMASVVLEHLPDPERALQEIARVASGAVVLSVPWEPVWRIGNLARGRYIGDLGNTPGHIQHFARRGFVRLVSRYLDVELVERPVPWTMVRARVRPA